MEECFFDKVLPNGNVVFKINDLPYETSLKGILIPETRVETAHIFLSERATDIPLRCTFTNSGNLNIVFVEYLAWRDKSGEVWKDLGETLVQQKLAKWE